MSTGSFRAWLELALVRKVSLEAKLTWLRVFGSPAEVLAQSPAALREHSPEGCVLRGCVPAEEIDAVASWTEQSGGACIFLGEPNYPRCILERLGNAPLALFARGDLSILEGSVLACAGAPQPTPDAMRMARTLALEAAQDGLAIAAGISPGIAQGALHGALTAKGKCLGIVGGARAWESVKLGGEILAAGGLLLGEIAPRATEPKLSYAQRHRLLAAVAELLLVIEAPLGCDTLKLAADAADVGCEVAAVPHSPTNEAGRGGNQLLKEGATLVEDARDIRRQFS